MRPNNARLAIVVIMLACTSLVVVFPFEAKLSTDLIFDDKTIKRLDEEGSVNPSTQLIIKIKHDDGKKLTNNLTRVQGLLKLEDNAMNNETSPYYFASNRVHPSNIETPFSRWSSAFESRNKSLENASTWTELLSPIIEGGWCGSESTPEEEKAFQATLLLLPEETTFHVACPAFEGSYVQVAPDSTEILWLINLKLIEETGEDWYELTNWAEKVSDETEYELSTVGINVLFSKTTEIAKNDVSMILLPSIVILGLLLTFGLRDPLIALGTLGGIGLVVSTEVGILSTLGFQFSVIDLVALPIIMGVAVDGAFWYCKSSRTREEVRKMLLIAMLTTVAAVSFALFSPIRAQRSLSLVMIVGIILNWVFTRFVLEEFYLTRSQKSQSSSKAKLLPYHVTMSWFWPMFLTLLSALVLIAPPGVQILDVNQFLPDDDPALEEMKELKSKYILASSTITWIVIDIDGDSPEDYQKVLDFQNQLSYHASIINLDTGLIRTPMIIGLQNAPENLSNQTINSVSQISDGSIFMEDQRLKNKGVTTGVAIGVLIAGENAEAALQLSNDIYELLDERSLEGEVGGDLTVGASLALAFDESRVTQILLAGCAVFVVSFVVLRSKMRASRIAIGTIAVGIAVDSMASLMGGRGVNTAPAVLLGMGFAADYLSHASAEHVPTTKDTLARWWAAITSLSIFILLAFAVFPPAKSTGQLLSISIIFSILLATFLSLKYIKNEEEE